MKKYVSRGFTLVELMIVIAIIGILAAVLYPAMTGYFERSRDTSRQGALRNITLSLSTYNVDNSAYPAASATCVKTALSGLVGKYIQALPKDPKNGFGVAGCEANDGYGYQLVKDSVGSASGSYILGARVENKANANYVKTGNAWAETTLQLGTGALKDVNSKITGGTGSVEAGTAYYVVGQ